MSNYEIVSLPGLSLLQYTAEVDDVEKSGPAVADLFGRLLPEMLRLGLDPDQPTVAWYDMTAQRIRLGAGVEMEDASAHSQRTDLEPGQLPGSERAIVTRYRGNLEGIGKAWSQLHGHLSQEGLTPGGPCREVYLAGRVEEPESWIVDLQQPLG